MFALACAIGLPGMPRAQSQSLDLLVGSYTDGDSAGLYLYAFDAGTGRIAAQPKQALRVHNPSWLVVTPDQRNVYAINENGPGNPDQLTPEALRAVEASREFFGISVPLAS